MMDGAGTSESHRGPNGGLAEVGAMLRDRRIELGHVIEAVARQTHIKVSYLRAIEEGRRRDLPGAAYTIGFVRTYADFLGLDGNRLVTDFHAQLAGARSRPGQAAQPVPEARRLVISPVVVAGAVLALALGGFFLWGYLSDVGREPDDAAVEEAAEGEEAPAADAAPDAAGESAPAEGATAAEPAQEPAATASGTDAAGAGGAAPNTATTDQPAAAADQAGDQSPAATVPGEDQVPPEAEAAEAPESGPVQVQEATAAEGAASGKVVLRARLESWVQITNEKGEPVLSRVLRAGETYTVPAEPGLMMTTGNAGGIDILLDGKKLKSLGSVGLVRRDFPLDPQKLKDGSAFKPAPSAQPAQ